MVLRSRRRSTKGDMHIANRPLVHVLVIGVAVLLAYCNTFQVPFQLDDIDNIVNNPAIKDVRYLTDRSWIDSRDNTDVFDKPLFKTRYIGYLTFAANYALDGLNVRGYHLVNILIHAANAVLLYWIVILTFRTPCFPADDDREPSLTGSRDFIALFTGLFFAVHPVQTQAVTYVVQRFASLATLFSLVALVLYIKFRLACLGPAAAQPQSVSAASLKRYAAYFLSLASVVLAMKTKEFGMLVPAVIALYEFVFFEGSVTRRLRYLVLFGLTMAILPITLVGINAAAPGAGGIDDTAAQISGALGGISRADYLFTQFRVIVTYIRLLFLPVDQAFDYDYPVYRSLFEPAVTVSFLFLLSIFACGLYLYRRSKMEGTRNRHLYRLGSFGIFWFFLTLSAESGVFPIADVIFEHRIYLPSTGFFIALSSIIALLSTRWGDRPVMKKTVAAATALLMLVLATATYARNIVWQDKITQLKDDISRHPGKARPHRALGDTYAEQGRMAEALHHMKTAIALQPNDALAHYSLGLAYAGLGRMEEAVYEYKLAIGIKFDYADAHTNLGVAYAKLGRIEEAVQEYRTAIMINPSSANARNNLGNAYRKLGRGEEAIREYRAALRLKPDFAEAHYNLGNTYAGLGRREEALAEYRNALLVKPDFGEARMQIERNSPKE